MAKIEFGNETVLECKIALKLYHCAKGKKTKLRRLRLLSSHFNPKKCTFEGKMHADSVDVFVCCTKSPKFPLDESRDPDDDTSKKHARLYAQSDKMPICYQM